MIGGEIKMVFLQKKRESLRKSSRAIAMAFCVSLLLFPVAGCGKVEEPIPVQLSSGKVEKLQNGNAGEIVDDPEESLAEDSDSAPEDVSGRETKVDTNEKAVHDTEDDTAVKAGQNDSSDENLQQIKVAQPQSVERAELEGNVRSIGANSLVVARNEVWSEGDALYAVGAAPGYEKEEDLITVYVNQNCVWEFKTVKNGGINPEDVSTGEGSFADLQEGIAISIKGSWQGDGSFLADSVVMMLFV